MANYNALLIRLQIAHELGVRNLQAYDNFELIICQVRGKFKVKQENLILYRKAVIQLAKEFRHF